jgi:hypothetical protein
MIRHLRLHRRANAMRRMLPREVVMHEMKRDSVLVHLDLLAESVRQSRKPAHAHAHGQILALDVAGRDVSPVGVAAEHSRLGADEPRRAIAPLGFGIDSENLGERRVIDFTPEYALDRIGVGRMPVGRKLEPSANPQRKIEQKLPSGTAVTGTHEPAWNQLRVGAQRRPRPHVTEARPDLLVERQIPLLGVDETPDFVALDTFAGQVTERRTLVIGACGSEIAQQFFDRHAGEPGNPGSSPQAIPLDQNRYDAGAFLRAQSIHSEQYACSGKESQARIFVMLRLPCPDATSVSSNLTGGRRADYADRLD